MRLPMTFLVVSLPAPIMNMICARMFRGSSVSPSTSVVRNRVIASSGHASRGSASRSWIFSSM